MRESTVGPNYINIYGVPWVVGAKKGFPNFNKFDLESAFQLTRKLQVTRTSTNDTFASNPSDYVFNQMFNLSVSNQLGVECWNSYTNSYNRAVDILVTNYFMSVALTNDMKFSTILYFGVSNTLQIPNLTVNVWPGYNPVTDPLGSQRSFQIPLDTNVMVVTNSTYRFNSGAPFLTTNLALPYEQNVVNPITLAKYPQPHWWLISTNNFQVVMIDHDTGAIIDYVALRGPNTVRDLTSEVISNWDVPVNTSQASGSELWNTNFNQNGVPIGILSQVGISVGNYTASSASGAWATTDPTQLADEIAGFMAFMGYTPGPPYVAGEAAAIAIGKTSLSNQVPYTPTATVVQHVSWQANDPLVHYLASDLNWPNAVPPSDRTVDSLMTNSPNGNLGQLNQSYRPWGGNPLFPKEDQNPYNLAVKDPLVWQSDDWDFPTYKLPTIGWLGRVHRGTPWQTVYLKSPDVLREIQINGGVTNFAFSGNTNVWMPWTGNINSYDATNMAPVQDRLLFDLFTTAPNDNATRGQLSVNVGASDTNNPVAGLAAWSALFSGVEVLANNAPDAAISTVKQHNGSSSLYYTYFPINPAGPANVNSPLGQIVTGINQTRANANNSVLIVSSAGNVTNEIPATFTNADGLFDTFEHVGDILAAPQLSDQSPFLNWNNSLQQQNGISDELYEWLPQQVMSLLRVSGTPQSPMRYVVYSYGQALKPAPNGIYTGSQTLANGQSAFGMVTNYQVVAESDARTVVTFGSVETNLVTTNALGNWISVPAVTNNTVIEQFGILPPY